MAIAALSPNSTLASSIQVNPQVKTDLQASAPQDAQVAQKAAKTAQTDTVTISAQALKMTDDKNAVAQKTANKTNEQQASQLASNNAEASKNATQRNAVQAFSAVGILGI